jgi:hypothetical protein
MAAWIRAWSSCSSTPPVETRPAAAACVDSPAFESTALVAILASMALSTLQEHRS